NANAFFGELLRWEIAASMLEAAKPDAEPPAGDVNLEPSLRAGGLALFASPEHAAALRKAAATLGAASASSPAAWIAAHFALGESGKDYAGLLAWLGPSDE